MVVNRRVFLVGRSKSILFEVSRFLRGNSLTILEVSTIPILFSLRILLGGARSCNSSRYRVVVVSLAVVKHKLSRPLGGPKTPPNSCFRSQPTSFRDIMSTK